MFWQINHPGTTKHASACMQDIWEGDWPAYNIEEVLKDKIDGTGQIIDAITNLGGVGYGGS
jgi:hypothetical protein